MKLKSMLMITLIVSAVSCCANAWAATCQEEGSHVSIDFIKSHFKNCSKCRTENIPAGKCAKYPQAHKHYYCTCGDGCKVTCAKNQYLSNDGKSCIPCPKNGKCDGGPWKGCPTGYYDAGPEGCVANKKCKTTEYLGNDGKSCIRCPKNGKCDGGPWKGCPKGYYDAGPEGCVPNKCSSNQYRTFGFACKACPANATCNGENFTCKAGYTKKTTTNTDGSGDGCVANKKCKTTEYLGNDGKSCIPCPKNGKCDGGPWKGCPKGYYDAGPMGCVSQKKCQQGSHISHAWIKERYKNCVNCRVENIKANTCSKNSSAHVHYYCDCDC